MYTKQTFVVLLCLLSFFQFSFGEITGPQNPCPWDLSTYQSDLMVPSGGSATWTASPNLYTISLNSRINNGQPEVEITWGNTCQIIQLKVVVKDAGGTVLGTDIFNVQPEGVDPILIGGAPNNLACGVAPTLNLNLGQICPSADEIVWTVTNGTIISGQGTSAIVVEPDPCSPIQVDVTARNSNCSGTLRPGNLLITRDTIDAQIDGPGSLCTENGSASALYLSGYSNPCATYQWSVIDPLGNSPASGVTIIGFNTPNSAVSWSAGLEGSYTVQCIIQACGPPRTYQKIVTLHNRSPEMPLWIDYVDNGNCFYFLSTPTPAANAPQVDYYEWSTNGGATWTGPLGPNLNIPLPPNTYQNVAVRAYNACGVSETFFDDMLYLPPIEEGCMHKTGAAVSGAVSSLGFSIYPNPVQAGEILTIDLGEEPGNATVQVVDIMGKVMLSSEVEGTQARISLRDLAAGSYFVRVFTDESQSVQKLLITQ